MHKTYERTLNLEDLNNHYRQMNRRWTCEEKLNIWWAIELLMTLMHFWCRWWKFDELWMKVWYTFDVVGETLINKNDEHLMIFWRTSDVLMYMFKMYTLKEVYTLSLLHLAKALQTTSKGHQDQKSSHIIGMSSKTHQMFLRFNTKLSAAFPNVVFPISHGINHKRLSVIHN